MLVEIKYKESTEKYEYTESTQYSDFLNQVSEKTKIKPSQLRLQIQSDQVKKDYITGRKPLHSQITENTILIAKNIGPQVGYRTVFIMEYAGPLFIWALFHKPLNSLSTIMWIFHFIKRELETMFVHKFSNDTMPRFNMIRNCSYYWAFALANAMLVKDTDISECSIVQRAGLASFFICEYLNFRCHIILRNLRPKGSTAYVNPPGFLFKYVACPNYTFEVLSWVSFSLYSQSIASWAFTLFGFMQISQWANQKRDRLNKTFGDKYGMRKWRVFWFIW